MSTLGNIKERIGKSKTVAGLEYIFKADGSFCFNIQLLSKNGKTLMPGESYAGITEKKELFRQLRQLKCPVIINYHGKGLLTRAFQDAVKDNFTEALGRLVPGSSESDFHIQLYNSSAGNSFVVILRKQQVSEILNEFASEKIEVVGFVLGNYHLGLLLPLFANQSSIQTINLTTQQLIFEDANLREVKIIEEERRQEEIQLEKKQIGSELFSALATAMFYFIPYGRIIHNNTEVNGIASEIQDKKLFVTLSRALIGFLLLVTLGNFFLFNSYFKQKADLDGELAVYESSLKQYDNLNQQLQSKQDFIEKSGLQSNSRLSYVTDRILYDAPKEVQLNYFSVSPVMKKPEKDSVLRFDTKKILIKGSCTKSIILNEWIKLMKSKDFVKDVLLDNYNQESENTSGKFDVTVHLN